MRGYAGADDDFVSVPGSSTTSAMSQLMSITAVEVYSVQIYTA